MEITYENEWGYTELHVDLSAAYEEDYQIRMLEHSEIRNLLRMRGSGRDGRSRYTYSLESGMRSMDRQFERKDMSKNDIWNFAVQLTEVIRELKEHFLDPGGILMSPELVFIKEGTYFFCYLPAKETGERKSLCSAFHEMTEYFVKKLDYQDTEGIFLVYRMHKETMTGNYELEEILKEYDEEYRQRKEKTDSGRKEPEEYSGKDEEENLGCLSEGAVFCSDEPDIQEISGEYHTEKKAEKIADRAEVYGPIRKVIRKIRTGYWGDWDDLITEMDRHKSDPNL